MYLTAAGVFAYGAAAALFAAGISLSIITPMLPAMHWIGGAIGWLLACIEIVVATPIWMVFHAHPEGHDVAGKGAAGYMLLLEACTRPIFMVCGLLAGFLLMWPAIIILEMIFFRSMTSVQTHSITGFISSIIFIMLYAGFCHIIVRKCFSAINILPAQIYRSIGGMNAGGSGFTEGVGQDMQHAGDSGARSIGAGGAAATGYTGKRMEKAVANQRAILEDKKKKLVGTVPAAPESTNGVVTGAETIRPSE